MTIRDTIASTPCLGTERSRGETTSEYLFGIMSTAV